MKKIKDNNSGFTLIELIIAMAVLAFLMTAVGTLMGSSVLSHKKSKAEINVHTSAQNTYNQVTDSIMQAKEVILIGYEAPSAYDFSEPGVDVGTTPQLVCYVKNQTVKDYILANPAVFGTSGLSDSDIKFFSSFKSDSFYVSKLVVVTSVPLDVSYASTGADTVDTIEVTNSITGINDVIDKSNVAASGAQLYTTNDSVINTYTFEENCMYYEKKYVYMTALDDVMNPGVATSKEACLYNDGFSYVKSSSASITACIAKVDANSGSIGIEFKFNDMNMTYTTNGMVNIRNSYVLKGKDD